MNDISIKLDEKQGVTPVNNYLQNQTTGIARIIIPRGGNRDEYVATVYRTGRIDLFDENYGQYIKQCYVTNEVLQNIKFPSAAGELGGYVVWVAQPFLFSAPLVVGSFQMSSQKSEASEEDVVVHKELNGGSLDIFGNTGNGCLMISVTGRPFGSIKISALGNEQSSISLESNGSVDIIANNSVKCVSYGNVDIQMINSENNDTTGITINNEECDISAVYSVDEDDEEKKNYTKTKITKNGLESEQYFCEEENVTKHFLKTTKDGLTVNSAIKSDENIFSQVVTDNEYKTIFKDCILALKEKIVMLSQGDGTKIEINDGKLSLMNQGQSLNSILSDIVSTIESLTVATSMGPSGTPLPPTIQKTQKLSKDLSNLFKE